MRGNHIQLIKQAEQYADRTAVIDASGVLTKKEVEAEDEFSVHLLGERNGLMAERIQPMIDAGGAFIAVGALHLSGKGGLVALLRERGLTLTPLW